MLKSILKVDTAKLEELDWVNTIFKYDLKVIKEATDIPNPFNLGTGKCQD